MKFGKTLVALGVAAMLFGGAGAVNAQVVIDNWTIDIGAIGDQSGIGKDKFGGYGVFGTNGTLGLSQMAFNALYHTIIAGPIAPGALQHTDTLGVITQAVNTNGLVNETTTGKILNTSSGFELTFASTTTQKILSVSGLAATTTHLGVGAGPNGVASNGTLNFYADIYSGADNIDSSAKANSSGFAGGNGMDDGFLIASFDVVNAGGLATGSFNNAALDGQDDASFVLTFNYNGILKDNLGVSLALGTSMAFTNSNTDADDNNNGLIDTSPSGWGSRGLGACGNSFADNCGIEDGSVNLAVPEPASLALVGAALVGLSLSRRRARK